MKLDVRNPFGRIKSPKLKRMPNDWLRDDEDLALTNSCVTRQERILHALLRFAGLRLGEATALIQRNIDLERDELRVTVSKSDSGLRTVPLHPVLRRELVAWLGHLETKASGDPICRFWLRANLRHGSAEPRHAAGARLELLGHADTRVTQASCYAELLDETVRAAALAAWSS
jgi:integrase